MKAVMFVTVRKEGTRHVVKNDALGLVGIGATMDEALIDFVNDFKAAWKYIGLERDTRLTLDAQELKRRLHAAVVGL